MLAADPALHGGSSFTDTPTPFCRDALIERHLEIPHLMMVKCNPCGLKRIRYQSEAIVGFLGYASCATEQVVSAAGAYKMEKGFVGFVRWQVQICKRM
jgi:hypothetical protein